MITRMALALACLQCTACGDGGDGGIISARIWIDQVLTHDEIAIDCADEAARLADHGVALDCPWFEADYAMTEGEGQTMEAEAIQEHWEQWLPVTLPEPVAIYDGMALASWYGDAYAGRLTASGEVFDPDGMTAASVSLPLGTVLEVCRSVAPVWPYGARCVRVVVNDRQPPQTDPDRRLDLSYEAARRLGMINEGLAYVYYREIAP